ncbi:MAG: recombinase family protein [Lachnospiraceae bacterium]|nr:recombinase family protein [Lachnospiraceae bacterium]
MARKSREQIQYAKATGQTFLDPASVKPAVRTAIYARLSLYDMNWSCRDSMQNQIHLLESYMAEHPELNLTDRYIDNGWSGMDFNRPAFKRLLTDIHSGKINCIVVKDLSRFGRNYVETGYYLENVFPSLGIRFIAINDHFDNQTARPDDLGIILKNILNEFFSRDLSRRYCASIDIRRQKGVFRHGTPYGYMHDPERPDYLTFDPSVSHYVHLIFQWALEGTPTSKIAHRLRQMNVPTKERMEYLRNKEKTRHKGSTRWDVNSVREMLMNPVYAGDFVYGKIRKRKCDPYNNRVIPKEEWTVISDAFPAYISHEQFDQIQERMEKNTQTFYQQIENKKSIHEEVPNYFKDLLYCAICGKKVHSSLDAREKSQSYLVYFCFQYGNARHEPHPRVNIHKKLLDTIVLDEIQNQFRLAEQFSQWLHSPTCQAQAKQWLRKQQQLLESLNQEAAQNKSELAQTFENFASACITEEMFLQRKTQLKQQEKALTASLEKQAKHMQEIQRALSKANPWLNLLNQFAYPHCLTESLTHTLIDRIILGLGGELQIIFREEHWHHLFTQYCEEIQHSDIQKEANSE